MVPYEFQLLVCVVWKLLLMLQKCVSRSSVTFLEVLNMTISLYDNFDNFLMLFIYFSLSISLSLSPPCGQALDFKREGEL